ncbi:helix-turn-helix domain-containing protein [uncultured Draconibacterium sp.]|uniref:helix-turn-helix domain-containing protein n=1 Tax=uncultured Draconibacterium sp. TaxID=1573823 RepID=UPI0029C616C6|nr:helix-turn-helix domain-containing protein [uncultured Draconibacterium sp.]
MPEITIWNLILLAEIGFGFILLLFLLKVSTKLNWYLPLAIYVLLVMIDCYIEFLLQTGTIVNTPHLLYVHEPLNILVGPMIYLYARSQEFQNFKLIKTDFLLFTPFLASLLVYLPVYAMSAADKINEFQQFGELESDVENFVWEWIFLVSINVTFFAAALRRFRNYNEKIKTLYSNIKNADLRITQILIRLCIAIYTLELFSVFLTYYELPFNTELYNIYDIVQLFILVLIGYDALSTYKFSATIKQEWQKIHLEDGQNINQPIKYASSMLTSKQSEKLKEKIEAFMDKHEPYLQSQIRIKDLADLTGISSHQISQVINESFNQNFYEFINTYRVKKAISLIEDSKNSSLTYSAIGFEAGFNSKTTFYEAFKKTTGTTPAQYKINNNIPNS